MIGEAVKTTGEDDLGITKGQVEAITYIRDADPQRSVDRSRHASSWTSGVGRKVACVLRWRADQLLVARERNAETVLPASLYRRSGAKQPTRSTRAAVAQAAHTHRPRGSCHDKP